MVFKKCHIQYLKTAKLFEVDPKNDGATIHDAFDTKWPELAGRSGRVEKNGRGLHPAVGHNRLVKKPFNITQPTTLFFHFYVRKLEAVAPVISPSLNGSPAQINVFP